LGFVLCKIDPRRVDDLARHGGAWYLHAVQQSLLPVKNEVNGQQ
jgi:hypothetical protein